MPATRSIEHPSGVEICIEPDGDLVTVAPYGDLDEPVADAIERTISGLVRQGYSHVVLDLRGLSFVGSCGAELLERLESAAHESDHTFGVRAGGGMPRQRSRRGFARRPVERSL